MQNCCYKNLHNPKKTGRATWVCPECGSDVSLAYVNYCQSVQDSKNILKNKRAIS